MAAVDGAVASGACVEEEEEGGDEHAFGEELAEDGVHVADGGDGVSAEPGGGVEDGAEDGHADGGGGPVSGDVGDHDAEATIGEEVVIEVVAPAGVAGSVGGVELDSGESGGMGGDEGALGAGELVDFEGEAGVEGGDAFGHRAGFGGGGDEVAGVDEAEDELVGWVKVAWGDEECPGGAS